jgi:hypothetical protein
MRGPCTRSGSKPEDPKGQLQLLCNCGRRRIELMRLSCCRLCYQRHYHSLRWFGGLRELILQRDRRRCRACGETKRLVVHHRTGDNAKQVLITLCVRCHVSVHRTRSLRRWLPEALLELWRELHPHEVVQMQLPLAVRKAAAADLSARIHQQRDMGQGHARMDQLPLAIDFQSP